jgi:pilus assembly protein Flp/PilA
MSSAVLKSKGVFTMTHFIRFIKDEEGATAIEYGLIAALVSVAAIASLQALGGQLSTLFQSIKGSLAR